MDNSYRRAGMVLTFDTVEIAQKARRLLVEAKLIEPDMGDDWGQIRSVDMIHEYNPDHGGPVWYIP